MSKLRNLLVVLSFLAVPQICKALDANYAIGVDLSSTSVTESSSAVGTVTVHTAIVGTQVLAANSDRLDFEIEIASCAPLAVTTTRLYYSFSSGISSSTVVRYPWVDQASTGGRQKITNPNFVNYEGPVYMVSDGSNVDCRVWIKEYSSTSQLFR